MRLILPMFAFLLLAAPASAAEKVRVQTRAPFEKSTAALVDAIQKNKMGLVTRANAQAGAASRGVKIRGNQVIGVFRPDFAIRMLKASVDAGFEAPIRIYIYENEDGTATIAYVKPSDVFAPYAKPDLDKMAKELDAIFARIVQDALAAARKPAP
ncbi:MAG: DUF302 domain-containing protein [Candidatus Tectomicrobia bacterium]|uniref:DUF302 domain-containing protein n=1 Tax=Tectimicrobiota bacterium TaxID=2528274 RepID=A0A932I252_UNCTE|nr:DUF302 domain-containing protein [Candidatus Tectomicrobia bacterium]